MRALRPARPLAVTAVSLAALTAAFLPSAAEADVDDFSYSSWDAEYDVSLDDEGRATAHVTETLVADFPEADQNKGIVRGYPQRYEGAGLDIRIESVTDAEGRDVPYETDTEDGLFLVLTGDDSFVHGRTTYVIDYTMRDFMITGSESQNDEFHWDLLPLDGTQAIDRFRADISFSPELTAALTGDTACYQGAEGSTRRCEIAGPRIEDGRSVFSVESGRREAGDGVTAAVGFAAGTVAQPPARSPDPLADFGAAALGGSAVAVAAGAWAAVAGFVRRRRRATGVIIAQYDVPGDIPPLLAAPLLARPEDAIPAQFVHLAVGGALRIEETAEADDSEPSLRLLDRSAVGSPLDTETLDALFPADEEVRSIPESSEQFSAEMAQLRARGREEASARGWLTRERSRGAMWFAGASVALLLAAVVFVVHSAALDRDALPLGIIVTIVAAGLVLTTLLVAFSRHEVLTPEGAAQHEYLQGVREFIRVAEADRLRMLQSRTGAERRRDGEVDVVVLYERLLPYAMLFGEESSWSEVLDTAYASADRSPDWMPTAVGTSLGMHLSAFSTSAHAGASYTAPSASTSSSLGGSTGGGFSGSGGGGGFSGGR